MPENRFSRKSFIGAQAPQIMTKNISEMLQKHQFGLSKISPTSADSAVFARPKMAALCKPSTISR